MNWRRRFGPYLRPPWKIWVSLTRRMTLGARVLVTNQEGQILLVRHTYMKGWELPGGGIERGELAGSAIARELLEEAGVRALEEPRLISIHSNHVSFRGDHVLFYRVDLWEPGQAVDQGEIEAVAWFSPDEIPANTTAGAMRRIGEALGGQPVSGIW